MGKDATTGFTAAFKLVVVATMSICSMTNGFSNYVSQNKAAGEYGRIKKGFWIILLYSLIVSVLFLAVFVSFARPLTKLFVQEKDLTEDALSYAVEYLTIVSCFLPVVFTKIVYHAVLRVLSLIHI